MLTLRGAEDLHTRVGETLGRSNWREVTQEHVDAFADLTGDHQWIHVDPDRARESPFGGTIVHGYFTLALAPALMEDILSIDGFSHGVNYGLDRVRFPAPCPVGSQVRMQLAIGEVEPAGDATQVKLDFTIEREGADKPVCAARWVARYFD